MKIGFASARLSDDPVPYYSSSLMSRAAVSAFAPLDLTGVVGSDLARLAPPESGQRQRMSGAHLVRHRVAELPYLYLRR